MNQKQLIVAAALCSALALSSSVTVNAQVTLVNMVPQNRSGETNQDAEPTIAVNPSSPLQLVGTAFTWDNLAGIPMTGNAAPIYVSTDGGQTWSLGIQRSEYRRGHVSDWRY